MNPLLLSFMVYLENPPSPSSESAAPWKDQKDKDKLRRQKIHAELAHGGTPWYYSLCSKEAY